MPLGESERNWFYDSIETLDPHHEIVTVERAQQYLTYNNEIRSDEDLYRQATPEELVRALTLCLLVSDQYNYTKNRFYIERYYRHGHPSSNHDEVDLIIYDHENQPFSQWEFKSYEEFERNSDEYIECQLFGTAPLVGTPKYLVYATIKPETTIPKLILYCIDREKTPSYESWVNRDRPFDNIFPASYSIPSHEPYVRGGTIDLNQNCSQADFRAAAITLHSEFFGEHPDNTIFSNLLKCVLVKIYDERQTKTLGHGIPKRECTYIFQIFKKGDGTEESASEVFTRINETYKLAYKRYIEPTKPDEINPKEFAPERVKTIVKVLQGMSITQGAALHGDIIGAFFEEILRVGFKQDKGMYFTHSNLVWFMLEAINLDDLTIKTWNRATHPENRLPYVIDPACGSGAFLLKAMEIISNSIRTRKTELVTDQEAIQYFDARLSDSNPHYWAESNLYGMDPKFIMAITAKINMVLHGDGSAHIFKYDALKPFSSYVDDKLKSLPDPQRTISKSNYNYDLVERFDVVVSNPPFGITIPSDTVKDLKTTFSLDATSPSECLFLERWFQLLKPKGRLGVVIPESLLNTSDNYQSRMFLYRFFGFAQLFHYPEIYLSTHPHR